MAGSTAALSACQRADLPGHARVAPDGLMGLTTVDYSLRPGGGVSHVPTAHYEKHLAAQTD